MSTGADPTTAHDPNAPAPLPSQGVRGGVITDDARHISPWTTREKLGRFLWAMVQGTLFRYSFTTWYRYRVMLLNLFGARVHPTCRIRRTARFECPWNFTAGRNCAVGDDAVIYALGPITLGDRVSVTQFTHLCAGTHDFARFDLPLIRPPIVLKDDAWLGTDSFVGPGVTMHEGALLGARSSAFKDLEPWTIYAGSPARKIKPRPPLSRTADTTNQTKS